MRSLVACLDAWRSGWPAYLCLRAYPAVPACSPSRMHACTHAQAVLAPGLSLEQGPARQLFVEVAMHRANAILFTERAPVSPPADR